MNGKLKIPSPACGGRVRVGGDLNHELQGWKMTTLGEVLERITKGTTPKKFSFEKDDVNYIKSESLSYEGNIDESKFVKITSATNSELKRSQLKENDILVSMAGIFLGKTGLVKKEMLPANTNQAVAILTVNQNVDFRFLWFKLRSKDSINYFNSTPSQSAQPNINFEEIKSLPLLLPPLPEQRAIESILSSLDDKIELLREQNKILEAIAQAIFKEWFVNFKFPVLNHDSSDLMINYEKDNHSPSFNHENPSSRQYSMDSLPEGWRVGRLSEIANFLNGLALQKFPPENNENYLPVIKIKELKGGISPQTDKASKKIDEKYIINNGDVLFSWSGSLGVDIWKYGQGALNQHLFKVTSEKYPKWFYLYWIKEHMASFQQIATSKAVTMGHIQRHHLDDALVVIPNEYFFNRVNKYFTNSVDKFILNNSQIQTLSSLRDTLLPKLMKGEIRISEP